MKYCSHCGKEVAEDATICFNCGCAVNSEIALSTTQKSEKTRPIVAFVLSIVSAFLIVVSYCCAFTPRDVMFTVGMALLVFIIPIEFALDVGALVCGVISYTRNKDGKGYGKKFALTAIVLSSILIVLVVILVIICFIGYDILPAVKANG